MKTKNAPKTIWIIWDKPASDYDGPFFSKKEVVQIKKSYSPDVQEDLEIIKYEIKNERTN